MCINIGDWFHTGVKRECITLSVCAVSNKKTNIRDLGLAGFDLLSNTLTTTQTTPATREQLASYLRHITNAVYSMLFMVTS